MAIPFFARAAAIFGFGRGAATAATAVSKISPISIGILGYSAYSGYRGAEPGKKVQGAAKGVLEGVLYGYMPQLIIANLVAGKLENAGNYYMKRMHQGPWEYINASRPNFGSNFRDTQQAATMRQRAVEEMQRSHINARSVLGSEARTYHRSGAYSGRY